MKNSYIPEHNPLNQDPVGRYSMGSKFNPTPDNNNRRMDSQGMDGIL